jgi:hypothetical protein
MHRVSILLTLWTVDTNSAYLSPTLYIVPASRRASSLLALTLRKSEYYAIFDC